MRTIYRVGFGLFFALGLASLAQAETCIQLDRAKTSDDNIDLLIAPQALEMAAVACHCHGTCTAPVATFAFTDRAGNGINLAATLTCSTGGGNSTWTAVSGADADRNLVEGEGLEVSVSNSPGGIAADLYTICVRFV